MAMLYYVLAVARALLGSGLLPNLGSIFHKSRYNAFPLADDVMEPYRPFVDEIVFRLYGNGITELNKESKAEIMRVLNCDVNIGKVKRPLQIALTITTASLCKILFWRNQKTFITYYDMTEDRLNAYHIMWLFVFFDLPVTTKKEMKAASLFRKNLEKDGFSMMQFSVYIRHLCIKGKFGSACKTGKIFASGGRK